jgi:hypothetical protein
MPRECREHLQQAPEDERRETSPRLLGDLPSLPITHSASWLTEKSTQQPSGSIVCICSSSSGISSKVPNHSAGFAPRT